MESAIRVQILDEVVSISFRANPLGKDETVCYSQTMGSPGGSTQQSSSCTATYHPHGNYPSLKNQTCWTCWRNRDELISDTLLWTPRHGRAKVGRPARTYIQHLCAGIECSLEDLPEVMDDREVWRERVNDIRADGATWWWWSNQSSRKKTLIGWLVGFYGISTFVGYLTPNPFLCK